MELEAEAFNFPRDQRSVVRPSSGLILCRSPFDSYVLLVMTSNSSSAIIIPFYKPPLTRALPSPTSSDWHPSISLILPFLSCQILADATGHCLTF